MYKTKIFSLSLIIGILLFFMASGCAWTHKTKEIIIIPKTTDVRISVLNNDDKYIPVDSTNLFIASSEYPLIVTQEKTGYIKRTDYFAPTIFNKRKLIDISLATAFVSTAIILVINNPENLYAMNLLIGAYIPLFGPWRVHSDEISLPVLCKLPIKDSLSRFLIVDKFEVNMPSDSLKVVNYNTYKNFVKQKSSSITMGSEPIKKSSSILKNDVNRALSELGYTDTSISIFKNKLNSVEMDVAMTSIEVDNISNPQNLIGTPKIACGLLKINVNILIHEFGSKKIILQKAISAKSDYFTYQMKDYQSIALSSAMRDLSIQLANDESINQILSRVKFNPDTNLNNTSISIPDSVFASDCKEAVKAVVTITDGNSHGSGCIISKEGYIVTNYHVTGDNDSTLKVILSNGDFLKCKLVSFDPEFDLALLKIESQNILPLKLNIPDEISLGEDVFAIGTPADLSLQQTITKGIVSGKRTIEDKFFIQTDAKVNPGNSGGALINEKGELIGIINSKLFGEGIEGIGFAVPAIFVISTFKITYSSSEQ